MYSTFLEFGAKAAIGILIETVLGWVTVILSIQGWLLTQLMNSLEVVMTWQVTSNNQTIFTAWETARNLTNMFFIVGLVIISFATIFRSFGVLQNYHWKSALPKLLIAAVMINLSLGLSETVVLVSNQVTRLFTNITRSTGVEITQVLGVDNLLASSLDITSLEPASRNLGNIVGSVSPLGTEWEAYLARSENRSQEENDAYFLCLTEERDVGYVESVTTFFGRFFTNEPSVLKSTSDCIRELAMKRRGETPVSLTDRFVVEVAATGGALKDTLAELTDTQQRITTLVSAIFSVLMMTVVIISLLSAVSFFVFRVIALWILMFASAFAFGFYWVGDGTSLKKWWNYFLGWNVFGPLYLLVIIFGMMFLEGQGALVASVTGRGDVGLMSALLQTGMFYLFAAIVFIGGLWLALNSAFAASVKSTPILGEAATQFGAFSAITASTALGKRAALATTLPARFEARRQQLVEAVERGTPEIIRPKSFQEQVATARRRIGLAGGAAQEARLLSQRVKAERERLNDALQSIPPGAQREAYLRKQMNSQNRAVALSAREMLHQTGRLNKAEIEATKGLLPNQVAVGNFERSNRGRDATKAFEDDISARFDDQKGTKSIGAIVGKLGTKQQSEALRVLAGKDPGAALSFAIAERQKANQPMSAEEQQDLQRSFFNLAMQPERFKKLDDSYFKKGSQNFDQLQQVVRQRVQGSKTKERNAFRRRLLEPVAGDVNKTKAVGQLFEDSAR